MPNERKRILVSRFQTGLFFRIAAYYLIYQVAVWNILFAWRLLQQGPGNLGEQFAGFVADFWPTIVCFILVVPVLCWDAMRFSHRLVGPIHRFRMTLQALASGEPVRPIKLRQGDYLVDMQDDINKLLESLQQRGIPALKPATPEDADASRMPA
jgi:hypothetical protein